MGGGARGLGPPEDSVGHAVLADRVVGAGQVQGLALDQRILFLLERRAGLAEALAPTTRHRPAGQRVGRHLVEEIRHRNVQYLGEFEQPARADAVGAALIILYLLQRDADGPPELLLAPP